MRQLKAAEELILNQGVRTLKLLQMKQLAIDNEDYMTAKLIKDEIDKIRSALG